MAKNWDCVKKWDLDNIKEKYGTPLKFKLFYNAAILQGNSFLE